MLIDDVIARIPHEIVKQQLEANSKYQGLQKSLDWAMKRGDMKRIQSFKAQMAVMGDQCIDRIASEIIASWEHNGTITQHVSTDAALEYANQKNALMFTYEILQSLVLDVKNWYTRQGVQMTTDQIKEQDPISHTAAELYELLTKDIENRYGKFTPEVKELWTDEADREYEYITKRQEVFHRKLMRIMNKEDKIQKAS